MELWAEVNSKIIQDDYPLTLGSLRREPVQDPSDRAGGADCSD